MMMEGTCFKGKRSDSTTGPSMETEQKEETMESNDKQIIFAGVMKTVLERNG